MCAGSRGTLEGFRLVSESDLKGFNPIFPARTARKATESNRKQKRSKNSKIKGVGGIKHTPTTKKWK